MHRGCNNYWPNHNRCSGRSVSRFQDRFFQIQNYGMKHWWREALLHFRMRPKG